MIFNSKKIKELESTIEELKKENLRLIAMINKESPTLEDVRDCKNVCGFNVELYPRYILKNKGKYFLTERKNEATINTTPMSYQNFCEKYNKDDLWLSDELMLKYLLENSYSRKGDT